MKRYAYEFEKFPFPVPMTEITDDVIIFAVSRYYDRILIGSDLKEKKIEEFKKKAITKVLSWNFFKRAEYLYRDLFDFDPRMKKYFSSELIDQIVQYVKENPEESTVNEDGLKWLEIGIMPPWDSSAMRRLKVYYRENLRLLERHLTPSEIACAYMRDHLMFQTSAGMNLQPEDVTGAMGIIAEISDQRFLETEVNEDGRHYLA